MKKRVEIRPKSTEKSTTAAADAWVEDRSGGDRPEPIKRLTVDMPQSLHRRLKTQCAIRGAKMADVVRALLMERFPE